MIRYNQNMPKTFFGIKPEEVIDRISLVRAQPWYPIPYSPGATVHTESEYAFPAFVVGRLGADMVKVVFEHRYVGERDQSFYPHELHLPECTCRACKGDLPA